MHQTISVLESVGVSSRLSQLSELSLSSLKRENKARLLVGRTHKRTASDLSGLSRENKENVRPTQGNRRPGRAPPQVAEKMRQAQEAKASRLDLSLLDMDDQQLGQLSGSISGMGELKTLKLSSNRLTENGLKKLLKALMNSRLEFLFLEHNDMTGIALDYILSYSKYNSHLRSVCLQGNNINQQSKSNMNKLRKIRAKGISVLLN